MTSARSSWCAHPHHRDEVGVAGDGVDLGDAVEVGDLLATSGMRSTSAVMRTMAVITRTA